MTKEAPIEAESVVVTEEIIEQIPSEVTEIIPETEEETILSVEEIEVEGGKKKIVKKMKKPKKPTEVTKEAPIEAESVVVTEEIIEQIPSEVTEVIPEPRKNHSLC